MSLPADPHIQPLGGFFSVKDEISAETQETELLVGSVDQRDEWIGALGLVIII